MHVLFGWHQSTSSGDCRKNCKIMYFQELCIWLAREHQLSQLMTGPGGSCWLLGALWAPMVAPGGSWRKYMKTTVVLSKTHIFHSPGLFLTSPKTYILDHSKCMKTIILSTSGSKARKPPNQASWGWFWWLLEPRLESHQIEPPWTGFLDVCSQGQQVIKSSFLGLVLPTSWAKAGNSSNRASWDSFCRLLEPRPESDQIGSAGTM